MADHYAVLAAVWRLVGEDEASRGHEHPADALAEGDLHAGNLVGGFSADLPDGFLHGEHSVHAGVGVGQAAASISRFLYQECWQSLSFAQVAPAIAVAVWPIQCVSTFLDGLHTGTGKQGYDF